MSSTETSSRLLGIPVSRPTKLIFITFSLTAVGLFFLFDLLHPVDWLQAETLRLRYYGLQAGVSHGPLSASLNIFDLLKPLVWEAQGGMFDGRYPIMLFDALIPKFYQYFYAWYGPSLREPVNLVFISLTWLILVLLIREWFGSTAAGLVAASFWLVTSQTLLDAHYPIRPNMALLTFLLVFILWELIRLPRSRSAVLTFICIGLALIAAIFTHEFALNFVPVIMIIFIMEWRRLRQWIVPAVITCISAWAVYLATLFWVLPPLAERVVGRLPPMDWMTGGLKPIFADPLILLTRVRDFVFVGVREMINQNIGAGCNLPVPLRLLGPAAAVVVLAAGGMKSLRTAFKPLLPAALYFIAVALFMFPVIPDTIEMPVYYYASIVVLFVLPLGALLSNFRAAKDQWRWAVAAGALLLIGVLNFAQSSMVLRQMPADFGFNATARVYTRDVLSLPPARRAEEVFSVPVYTAYPRPRVFDISRRWDTMLRVWHGEAEQVFSMMMPVLNLRLYERRHLIGDPDEFLALALEKPDVYEARAGLYWDLPARRLYHLGKIRAAALKLDEPSRDWINLETAPFSARELRGRITTGLLGDQPRVSLPPGRWSLPIPPPSAGLFDSLTMFFLLRADLMPPGPDDVMERITPLPLRVCRAMVRKTNGEGLFAQEQSFGWSWQLFQVTLPFTEDGWELIVESEAEFEVIGPTFVTPEAGDLPWSSEYTGDFSHLAI